jgi:hypothetical protein
MEGYEDASANMVSTTTPLTGPTSGITESLGQLTITGHEGLDSIFGATRSEPSSAHLHSNDSLALAESRLSRWEAMLSVEEPRNIAESSSVQLSLHDRLILAESRLNRLEAMLSVEEPRNVAESSSVYLPLHDRLHLAESRLYHWEAMLSAEEPRNVAESPSVYLPLHDWLTLIESILSRFEVVVSAMLSAETRMRRFEANWAMLSAEAESRLSRREGILSAEEPRNVAESSLFHHLPLNDRLTLAESMLSLLEVMLSAESIGRN